MSPRLGHHPRVMTRLAAIGMLALAASACADGGVDVRAFRTTLFVDGSPARAMADIDRGDGDVTTHLLDGVTAQWFDGRVWLDGAREPKVRCPGPGPDYPIELGYVETNPSDDAPGGTLIAFVRCL